MVAVVIVAMQGIGTGYPLGLKTSLREPEGLEMCANGTPIFEDSVRGYGN